MSDSDGPSRAGEPGADPVAGRFRVVPAAYVVLRRADPDEQVLLQLRQNTGYRDGYWAAAAAGHVERDESVFTAACREAREELDIVIDPADLVPLTVMHRTAGNGLDIDERVDFFFECRRWRGEPRLLEPHKAAALDWWPLDRLPEPLVPHEHLVYACLHNGSRPAPVIAVGFTEPSAASGPAAGDR